ncbi:MAG: PQQ-dependent sugar dehydrogenase [Bacteroidota bacterium]|nr:PQQ-dependent sugar dehydrogenase [Bacteroidota bacterium]
MKIKITLACWGMCAINAFAQPTVSLVPLASGFAQGITDIENAGDNRLFVVEQLGYISIIDSNGTVLPNYFLNIHPQVTPTFFSPGNEQGLLGLAFSPDFQINGYFYVNYTNKVGVGNTVISRFSVSDTNPNMADMNSEEILLTIYQPYSNHNGGDLAFGADGYLYIALGDGGNGGDPENRAQNLDSLLGKVLRIDVSDSVGYTIPPTNPFVLGQGAPEIWAYGLRNPWRMSFDKATSNLWISDVGQGSWEEINFQPVTSVGGENYGWRCYEGTNPFNTTGCNTTIGFYTPPVYEYAQSATGGCAVTGGYVYRGLDYPDLTGYYFYSDYCNGQVYALSPTFSSNIAGSFVGNFFTTFGENYNGELFIASQSNGTVYKIASTITSLEDISGDIARVILYPNPNLGTFTLDVEIKNPTTIDMEISDLAGKVCYKNEKKLVEGFNTLSIDMESKAAGSYLLKLTTMNGVFYEKFDIFR